MQLGQQSACWRNISAAKHTLKRFSNLVQLVPRLPGETFTPEDRDSSPPRQSQATGFAPNCWNPRNDTTAKAPRPSPSLPRSPLPWLQTVPPFASPSYLRAQPWDAAIASKGPEVAVLRLLATANPSRGGSGRADSAVPAAELLQVAGPPRAEAALVTRAGLPPSCGERAGPGGAQTGLGPEKETNAEATREWAGEGRTPRGLRVEES